LALGAWQKHAAIIGPIGLAVVLSELILAARTTRPPTPSFAGRSLILGRRLVCLMLLVLAGFAATLAYAFVHLAPILGSVDALVLNAMPAADDLSEARSAITDLQVAVPGILLSGAQEGSATRTEVEATRRRLDAAVAAELTTPYFPGEQVPTGEMLRALGALDAQTAEALAFPKNETLEGRVQRATAWLAVSQRADRAVAYLEAFHLHHGTREARSILDYRQTAAQVAAAMFLATLLAATAATVMTIRIGRVRSNEAAIHEQFLVDRADELEAFARRVAHDLKDPLGALSMRLGMLRVSLGSEAPELAPAIDKAVEQIERIDELLCGLLEFARSGGKPVPGARAELREVVDHVIEELAPVAGSAHAELFVDPFLPGHVACTPGALQSVLTNLVGNAVKYVREGQRPVRRVQVHVEDRAETVRVEVADTGPGLPPGVEQIVFQPFVKVGPTKLSGTGLGLATAKRIVEAYGGTIGVRSSPGVGSCFWFEIPKAQGV
jgi:signal transduction histidine kinase